MANDFLVFGGGAGANVISQVTYSGLAARTAGFSSGVAQSAQLNKVWRQSSIMSAVLGQFISDRTGQDVLDDGTTATILANLKAAATAYNGSLPLSASTSLIVAGAGAVIYFFGSTPGQTLALPAALALTAGQGYTVINFSSVPVTVARSGADTILAGNGVPAVVLQPGDDLEIAVANTSQWVAKGSAVRQFNPLVVAAATSGNHAAQLAQTGFQNTAIYRRISGTQQVSINGAAFTTSGATSFPAPVSGKARVKLWGAGCGGGGTSGSGAFGGGGGAGAYAEAVLGGLTIPTAVTVGTGGTGGTATPTAGGNGGTSSFGTRLTATGGGGGNPQAGSGTQSGGGGGAGGGSDAGLIVPGTQGGTAVLAINQLANGGGTFATFPTPGPSASVASTGFAGNFPGGGATGSGNGSAGSAGADGLIIVEY